MAALVAVFDRLIEAGASIIVIDHHLDLLAGDPPGHLYTERAIRVSAGMAWVRCYAGPRRRLERRALSAERVRRYPIRLVNWFMSK